MAKSKDSEDKVEKRSVRIEESPPTLERLKKIDPRYASGGKTPQKDNSSKPHKANQPKEDQISAWVPDDEGGKWKAKFGQKGDEHRPKEGKRRVPDKSLQDITNPAAAPEDVQFKTEAGPRVLSDELQEQMRKAEEFLESSAGKKYARDELGVNLHDQRGERAVQITGLQHGAFRATITYSDGKASDRDYVRKKVDISESQISDMAAKQTRIENKENIQSRLGAKGDVQHRLKRQEGRRKISQPEEDRTAAKKRS